MGRQKITRENFKYSARCEFCPKREFYDEHSTGTPAPAENKETSKTRPEPNAQVSTKDYPYLLFSERCNAYLPCKISDDKRHLRFIASDGSEGGLGAPFGRKRKLFRHDKTPIAYDEIIAENNEEEHS